MYGPVLLQMGSKHCTMKPKETNMKLKKTLGLATAALASSAVMSSGATYTEVGDAGQDFASFQVTSGVGTLDQIIGATDTVGDGGVDHYLITITDVSAFYATTDAGQGLGTGGASYDTLLALFLPDGTPLLRIDDTPPSGTPFHSYLSDPSTFPGAAQPSAAPIPGPGDYILAVAGFGATANDAGGGNLFTTAGGFDQLEGPDPAAGPFDAWAPADTGTYTVELGGATFAIPEPSSLALAGLGLLGLVRRRRA